jgi:hypothetical protein
MRLHEVPSMTLPRWTRLARHGLLGGTLVGVAHLPAAAAPCENSRSGDSAGIVGFTLGVDLSPKLSLIGGLEVRACLSDNTEAMARLELGGGGLRLIGGVRARPMEDGGYAGDRAAEQLGVEAGLAVDLTGSLGAHLAGSFGTSFAYAAVQALFPLTTRPNLPPVTRTSLNLGFSPWSAFESQVVEGRPLADGGRILTPDILALGAAHTAEDRAVRDHFTRSARFEYSSVWTFLRLAAELSAIGAPAHLVAAALDAADDEVRHAELCAQAAGGLRLAPLELLAAQPRFTHRSPAALALLASEAWAEGCLNEGAAAEEARLASLEATDATRGMLATIAEDEARHAALSWSVLAWVHAVAPALARNAAAIVPRAACAGAARADVALARRGVASPAITAAAKAHAADAATLRLRALLA